MTALYGFLGFVLPLVGLFVLGIGLWAIGQLLRRKGYGDQLDKIDGHVTAAKRVTGRVASPLGGAIIGAARGMSRIPLLGSKRSRAMWDDLEQRVQPPKQDK